jgi:O-antigen ligase
MNSVVYLMFFMYFLGGYQLFPIGNYGFTCLDASTIVLYFIILKKVFWDRELLEYSFNSVTFFLIMILATAFISVIPTLESFNAVRVLDFTKSFSHLFFLSAFALITCFFRIEIKVWDNIIKSWIILAIFLNLFGIYQIIARAYNLPLAWIAYNNVSLINSFTDDGSGFTLGQLSLSFGSFFRATSIFSEPTALAGFNSLILGLIIAPIIRGTKHFIKSKFVLYFSLVITLIGLFLTFSITGAACVGAILLTIFLVEKGRKKYRIVIIAAFAIVLIGIADVIVNEYLDASVLELFNSRISSMFAGKDAKGVESTAGDSNAERALHNYQAINLWQKHPIFGTGIGQMASDRTLPLGNVENSFFAVLVETGIFGALSFLAFFISMFCIAVRINRTYSVKKDKSDEFMRMTGVLLYILAVQSVINFLSGNNYITPNLWIIIAIVTSVINTVLVDENRNVKRIYLIDIPLKDRFNKYTSKYILIKSKNNNSGPAGKDI